MAKVTDLLFGENSDKKIQELYLNGVSTKDDAKKVLDAIVHPQIIRVINNITAEIDRGTKTICYDYYAGHKICSANDSVDGSREILFTDEAYYCGLMKWFYNLMKHAFPEYELPSKQSIGEVKMQKK